MRRKRAILIICAGVIAVVLVSGALKRDESPRDVTGVNPGYPELFRELEKSWEFERPIAVPPDPATMLERSTPSATN